MSWVDDTVAEFGRSMGIPSLRVGEHGNLQLKFAAGGLLAIEPVRRGDTDEILVYLGEPLGFGGARRVVLALSKAHFRNAGVRDVQIAVRGEGADSLLLALTRIPEREFTPQNLGHAVDYLHQWLGSVAA